MMNQESLEIWRKYFEYWKSYPDRFIDFISPPDCKIKLFFYQRVLLRIMFRYKKVYFTFTRGTSKSFLEILTMYLKCIFFPGIKLFIAAPGKEQAAKISQDNIENIWDFFPILKNELNMKACRFQNDYTKLVFKNGSRFDVVQVAESSRGGRRHGGAIEEIVDEKMKKDTLNEVVIPMMANDRIAMNGKVDRENELHKTQVYVTTAGNRQSFAFEKLMETLHEMAQGKSAFVLGAGYELACMHDLLDIEFINDLREQPTYSPLSFMREYESIWTGTSDNSLVSLDDLNACRVVQKAEDRAVKGKDVEYVLSYDVARREGKQNADSALTVWKLTPRGDGTYRIQQVNMYSQEGTHFDEQGRFIKQKAIDFKARAVVIDANGLGAGLIDALVRSDLDENPPWSVINDDRYDKYKKPDSVPMIYAISSNTKDNKASSIHNNFMNMVQQHRVQFLVSASSAKTIIQKEATKRKKKLESEEEAELLRPYILTDLFADEVMNLEYQAAGNDTRVKQISRRINKDKFSSVEYGLWYIHLLEKKNLNRRQEVINPSDFIFISKAKFH